MHCSGLIKQGRHLCSPAHGTLRYALQTTVRLIRSQQLCSNSPASQGGSAPPTAPTHSAPVSHIHVPLPPRHVAAVEALRLLCAQAAGEAGQGKGRSGGCSAMHNAGMAAPRECQNGGAKGLPAWRRQGIASQHRSHSAPIPGSPGSMPALQLHTKKSHMPVLGLRRSSDWVAKNT